MSLQAFLKNRWSQSGLKKNENILLHSSFKRTFNDLKEEGYKFNPEDILDSLLDLVTPDGTLVLPTFNFDFNTIKKYDYYNTKSQMGIVTELARQRSDFTRTLNPVYSFAVYGKDAYKFENIDNVSWYSKESPFKIIHKDNYKICIIDLEERNSQTFAHYCEEYFQVPWRYYKEFSGDYTDKNQVTTQKIYKGYVRKADEGVETTLNPAGELLWKMGKFYGNKPLRNNGLRYVFSQDYFNLFEKLLKEKKSSPYYYKTSK